MVQEQHSQPLRGLSEWNPVFFVMHLKRFDNGNKPHPDGPPTGSIHPSPTPEINPGELVVFEAGTPTAEGGVSPQWGGREEEAHWAALAAEIAVVRQVVDFPLREAAARRELEEKWFCRWWEKWGRGPAPFGEVGCCSAGPRTGLGRWSGGWAPPRGPAGKRCAIFSLEVCNRARLLELYGDEVGERQALARRAGPTPTRTPATTSAPPPADSPCPPLQWQGFIGNGFKEKSFDTVDISPPRNS